METNKKFKPISGATFGALLKYFGFTQERAASDLGFKDRGSLIRLLKKKVVPVDIISEFFNKKGITQQDLDKIIPFLTPELELDDNEENYSNKIIGDISMEKQVNNLLYKSFQDNIEGKNLELDRLKRDNDSLQKELVNSQTLYYQALREIDNIKHYIEVQNIKTEQRLKEMKIELQEYIDTSQEKLSEEIQNEVLELLKQELGSANSLSDKFFDKAEVFAPLIQVIGKILEDKVIKNPLNDNISPSRGFNPYNITKNSNDSANIFTTFSKQTTNNSTTNEEKVNESE